MRSSRRRYPGATRTSYSLPGARKMHVALNQPEAAERHGTGHVARCTVERLMGDLGLRGVRRARSPRTTRSAPREQCPGRTCQKGVSARSGRTSCGSPTFPRRREAPLLCTRLLRVGLCGFRD